MKLYYSPGACSLSPHIVAREAGIKVDLQKVNTKDKSMEGGGDFWSVNAKGYVPTLELDNGERLTEGPAIVQYLADQKPEKSWMVCGRSAPVTIGRLVSQCAEAMRIASGLPSRLPSAAHATPAGPASRACIGEPCEMKTLGRGTIRRFSLAPWE